MLPVEQMHLEIPQHPEMELLKERDRQRKNFGLTAATSIVTAVISTIATKQFGAMGYISLAVGLASTGVAFYHHHERKKELKDYQDGPDFQYSYRTAMANIFRKACNF